MVSGLLVTSGFGGVGWELEVVISYCLEGFFSQLVDVPFSCLLDLVDGLEKVGLVAPFSNFLNGGEFLTVVFVVCVKENGLSFVGAGSCNRPMFAVIVEGTSDEICTVIYYGTFC